MLQLLLDMTNLWLVSININIINQLDVNVILRRYSGFLKMSITALEKQQDSKLMSKGVSCGRANKGIVSTTCTTILHIKFSNTSSLSENETWMRKM